MLLQSFQEAAGSLVWRGKNKKQRTVSNCLTRRKSYMNGHQHHYGQWWATTMEQDSTKPHEIPSETNESSANFRDLHLLRGGSHQPLSDDRIPAKKLLWDERGTSVWDDRLHHSSFNNPVVESAMSKTRQGSHFSFLNRRTSYAASTTQPE